MGDNSGCWFCINRFGLYFRRFCWISVRSTLHCLAVCLASQRSSSCFACWIAQSIGLIIFIIVSIWNWKSIGEEAVFIRKSEKNHNMKLRFFIKIAGSRMAKIRAEEGLQALPDKQSFKNSDLSNLEFENVENENSLPIKEENDVAALAFNGSICLRHCSAWRELGSYSSARYVADGIVSGKSLFHCRCSTNIKSC